MEIDEAIKQLERISHSIGSIGENVDYTDKAIEALKFKKEYQEKVQALQEENQKLYKQLMENERNYQLTLEEDEKIHQDVVYVLKKEYQDKVQKCIERIERSMIEDTLHINCRTENRVQKAFIETLHYAISIIKEELGVQE